MAVSDWSSSASATSMPLRQGASTGTLTFSGVATGGIVRAMSEWSDPVARGTYPVGEAIGSFSFVGTDIRGGAGPSVSDWSSSAQATTQPAATAVGTITWVGVATGGTVAVSDWSAFVQLQTPTAGRAQGALSWVGTAEGGVLEVSEWSDPATATTPVDTARGDASGVIVWVGGATGEYPGRVFSTIPLVIPFVLGESANRIVSDWSAPASDTTDAAVRQGGATGSISWVGSAAGSTPTSFAGNAVGGILWAGLAEGRKSGGKGEALGTNLWAGTAEGARQARGGAFGVISWAGTTGGGKAVTLGSAHGIISWGPGYGTGIGGRAGAAEGTFGWHLTLLVGRPTPEPTYLFTPPSHEEPIRTNVRPVNYYRLTYANTIVRNGSTFTSVRSPVQNGTPGQDYFVGGHEYVVDQATADALTAAGYSVTFIPSEFDADPSGYGMGKYGTRPYGD